MRAWERRREHLYSLLADAGGRRLFHAARELSFCSNYDEFSRRAFIAAGGHASAVRSVTVTGEDSLASIKRQLGKTGRSGAHQNSSARPSNRSLGWGWRGVRAAARGRGQCAVRGIGSPGDQCARPVTRFHSETRPQVACWAYDAVTQDSVRSHKSCCSEIGLTQMPPQGPRPAPLTAHTRRTADRRFLQPRRVAPTGSET